MTPVKYRLLTLPAGPRDLPDNLIDADVQWRDGFDNDPDVHLYFKTDPLSFTKEGNPVWEQHDGAYIAEQDGFLAVHYHGGRLSKHPEREGVWQTTQQEGYCGRHYPITLKDGREVILRGPWHGGPPKGFIDTSYYCMDWTEKRNMPDKRPWMRRTHCFGLYTKRSMVIDALATFQPHIPWAVCTDRKGKARVMPCRPETGLPKGVLVDPADCPGHKYRPGREHPGHRCLLCGQQRDPEYVPEWKRKARA